MRNRGMRRTAALGCLLLCAAAIAKEPRTAHTYQLAEGEAPPAAALEDAGWLVGSWEGECFGARCEEAWNAPSAGSMVGMYKLFDDDGVHFYELMLLVVEDDTLVLKVKHFSADFSAWEDKADYVSFRLVAVEPDALHFGGISFYRRNPDQLDIWIVLKKGDEVREHLLTYRRVVTDSTATP